MSMENLRVEVEQGEFMVHGVGLGMVTPGSHPNTAPGSERRSRSCH
jgi:hypothetical protein